jgi:hypothetical protein
VVLVVKSGELDESSPVGSDCVTVLVVEVAAVVADTGDGVPVSLVAVVHPPANKARLAVNDAITGWCHERRLRGVSVRFGAVIDGNQSGPAPKVRTSKVIDESASVTADCHHPELVPRPTPITRYERYRPERRVR